jgi:phage gpG-like protein
MSRMSAIVAAALTKRPVMAGLEKVIQASVQRHIATSEGREGRLKPIKNLFGVWKDSRGVKHVQAGYRNNGQPLRDTGNLMRSIRARIVATGGGMQISVRGAGYGKPHEKGFATKGPVWIPLTKKGKRNIAQGSAYLKSKHGRDYIVAKTGTVTPARPYLLPTPNDMKDFGRSMAAGLAIVLKGRLV